MIEKSGLKCTTGTHPAYFHALPNDGKAYNFRKVMLPSFMFFGTRDNGQNPKLKQF
jgi:hypothetical protein